MTDTIGTTDTIPDDVMKATSSLMAEWWTAENTSLELIVARAIMAERERYVLFGYLSETGELLATADTPIKDLMAALPTTAVGTRLLPVYAIRKGEA